MSANIDAAECFGLTVLGRTTTGDGRQWVVYDDGQYRHAVSATHFANSGCKERPEDAGERSERYDEWHHPSGEWADDLTAIEAAHRLDLSCIHSADGCGFLASDTHGFCRAICDAHYGDTLDSPAFRADADRVNWDCVWPVVDGDGTLTGEITEGGGGWLSVGCEGGDGMIERSVARGAGWEINDDRAVAKPPAPAVHPSRWIATAEEAEEFLGAHHYVRLEYRKRRDGWVAVIASIDGTPHRTTVRPMPHGPMPRKSLERTLAHRYLATVTDDDATVNLRWARSLPNWAGTLGALPELALAIEQVEREAASTVKS